MSSKVIFDDVARWLSDNGFVFAAESVAGDWTFAVAESKLSFFSAFEQLVSATTAFESPASFHESAGKAVSDVVGTLKDLVADAQKAAAADIDTGADAAGGGKLLWSALKDGACGCAADNPDAAAFSLPVDAQGVRGLVISRLLDSFDFGKDAGGCAYAYDDGVLFGNTVPLGDSPTEKVLNAITAAFGDVEGWKKAIQSDSLDDGVAPHCIACEADAPWASWVQQFQADALHDLGLPFAG
ncbi:MAG: hypothetical protein LBR29_00785 [Methylobacteriaceae bacterium]|nr:hypothetical protein [Methylobacteriaceae bacterium]